MSKTSNLQQEGKRILLKLDDLTQKNEQEFLKTYNLIKKEKVKASFGIVTNDLDEITMEYRGLIDKILQDESFEIWQHGHLHKRNGEYGEYKNTTLEEQLNSITLAQKAMKENFGYIPTTFGAPYNDSDYITQEALKKQGDIKTLFFMDNIGENFKYLNNFVQIENGTGKVDFNFFKTNLILKENRDLIVLQGHPDRWYGEIEYYKEFLKIISYLKKENYIFVLPRDIN